MRRRRRASGGAPVARSPRSPSSTSAAVAARVAGDQPRRRAPRASRPVAELAGEALGAAAHLGPVDRVEQRDPLTAAASGARTAPRASAAISAASIARGAGSSRTARSAGRAGRPVAGSDAAAQGSGEQRASSGRAARERQRRRARAAARRGSRFQNSRSGNCAAQLRVALDQQRQVAASATRAQARGSATGVDGVVGQRPRARRRARRRRASARCGQVGVLAAGDGERSSKPPSALEQRARVDDVARLGPGRRRVDAPACARAARVEQAALVGVGRRRALDDRARVALAPRASASASHRAAGGSRRR